MSTRSERPEAENTRPEFLRYETDDHEILQALLWDSPRDGKAIVIYVASATGGFVGQHDLGSVAVPIRGKGYAFMAINVRTLGRPDGWVFSRFEDCVQDVGAAVRVAKSRDFTDIVLVGHSLGGPRAMYYWVQTREQSVRALVFMGSIVSPYGEAQLRWPKEKRAEYDRFLQYARDLIAQGRGGEVLTYKDFFREPGATVPPNLTLSAQTFVNLFGAPHESNASIVKFADQITIPTLVIHSPEDEMAIGKNAEEIYAKIKGAPRRDLVWVKGAHMLNKAEDARNYGHAIAQWLWEVVPPLR